MEDLEQGKDIGTESPGGAGRGRRWWLVAFVVVLMAVPLALVGILVKDSVGPPQIRCRVITHLSKERGDDEGIVPRWVDRQVILLGPQAAVSSVFETLRQKGVLKRELTVCDVRLRAPDGESARGLPFSAADLSNLSLGLFEIDEGPELEAAVGEINAAGNKLRVYADPNYLVGVLGQSACGAPYEVVGSPYEVVGSPLGLPEVAAVPPELFAHQWAVQQIDAGAYLTYTGETLLPKPKGTKVRVAVLDTSPFTVSPEALAEAEALGNFVPVPVVDAWWQERDLAPTLSITTYVAPLPELSATGDTPTASISSHGLFVAGLVHSVAPASEIHLYRVLDEHGCGTLFGVNRGILDFVTRVQNTADPLDGAVINLSLGVHKPRTPDQPEAVTEANGMSGAGTAPGAYDYDWHAENTIKTLRGVVDMAHQARIAVVAAAGNDSYLAGDEGLVLSPHLPAAYPTVLGVAASNATRQRACFSNWGDVYAPGGEGGPLPNLEEENPDLVVANPELPDINCLPLTKECSGNCPASVISLIEHNASLGLAYWSGTSFSAPMASGLAALVYEAEASAAGGGVWPSAEYVFEALRCGSSMTDGVINVASTLYRCLP